MLALAADQSRELICGATLFSPRVASKLQAASSRLRYNGAFDSGPSVSGIMTDVTRILSAIEQGDPHAASELLPLVYDELKKLAAQRMAQENPGQTLQATALVHEAYLRLVAPASGEASARPDRHWNSRGHFFAAAAEAMRRILVDQARRRKTAKRGGEAQREELHESAITAGRPPEEMLAVDELLDRLAEIDPAAANLVKLRFFVGLNMSEVAEALGVSLRTAHDTWAYARTWLHQSITAE
jgi:RNA polymerase sigma factor (TIGR02999 family)